MRSIPVEDSDCLPLCQIFRKFRSKHKWNASVQVEIFRKSVLLQRWSSLTGWSGPTETCRSIFKNSRFQSHFTEKLSERRSNTNGEYGVQTHPPALAARMYSHWSLLFSHSTKIFRLLFMPLGDYQNVLFKRRFL